jgi:hypothetical protein
MDLVELDVCELDCPGPEQGSCEHGNKPLCCIKKF